MTPSRRVDTGRSLAAWHEALARLVDASHLEKPSGLAAAIRAALAPTGADLTLYLVDREQRTLRALPEPGRPTPDPLPIDSTVAGRAFGTVSVIQAPGDPTRLWVPVVDGTERLGVLEIVAPADQDPDEVREGAVLVAGLVGHLVVAKTVYGDSLHTARRSRPMSVAAELLWQLLPPLTFVTDGMVLTAVLEPCYDVGGDAFDYAVDGPVTRMALYDSVGHGLPASLTSAVALAATRACRREGGDLVDLANAADKALSSQFPDQSFVTAILGELVTDDGTLRYLNAGHPAPVLIRHHKAVRQLDGGRRRPLGLAGPAVRPGEEMLEPGDWVLFYTDGVTEARNRDGELFGLGRLMDLAERGSVDGLPAAETLRRLCHAVRDFQHGDGDDLSLMLVEWSPTAVAQNLP